MAKGPERGYWLKQIEQARPSDPYGLYSQAQSYAHLGQYDRAFDLLDQHFAKTKLESLESLLFDECWDPVHENPRFVALLKKTGLRK
jgi:hypothetical protein